MQTIKIRSRASHPLLDGGAETNCFMMNDDNCSDSFAISSRRGHFTEETDDGGEDLREMQSVREICRWKDVIGNIFCWRSYERDLW